MAYCYKIFTIFSFVCILLLPTSAYAQNIKIAVVDIDKILSESKAGKSVRQQLNSRRESFQKEFSALEDNLTNAQETLMQKKNDLTAEEFTTKRKNFEKQLFETQNLFKKRRNALDKGLGDALAKLRQHIIRVTAEIANEKKYQVVLTRDSVVIIEKEMDITETVLSRLNAQVSNIPLDTE